MTDTEKPVMGETHEEWEQWLRTYYARAFESYLQGRSIEIGPGWRPIVEEAVAAIAMAGGGVTQIKEKLGGLRIYTNGGVDEERDSQEVLDRRRALVSEIVDEATRKAAKVCEQCGAPGVRRGRGWLYVSCDAHVKEQRV